MAWIKRVPIEEDDALRSACEGLRDLYPEEYFRSPEPSTGSGESIVSSHSLIPDALFHAFATFGALMSDELPLSRREHELITTVVSVSNRCRY